MLILIMRHGEAEARPDETDRHLTEKGLIQVRSVLGWAKQMGLQVDSILSSPLTRAKETASLASSIFGTTNSVDNSLEPEGSPDEVYEALSKFGPSNVVLLVTHQPLVSILVEDILESKSQINMTTGSLAVVMAKDRPTQGSGVLLSLIPPFIPSS